MEAGPWGGILCDFKWIGLEHVGGGRDEPIDGTFLA
jgi:hypothetical protein